MDVLRQGLMIRGARRSLLRWIRAAYARADAIPLPVVPLQSLNGPVLLRMRTIYGTHIPLCRGPRMWLFPELIVRGASKPAPAGSRMMHEWRGIQLDLDCPMRICICICRLQKKHAPCASAVDVTCSVARDHMPRHMRERSYRDSCTCRVPSFGSRLSGWGGRHLRSIRTRNGEHAHKNKDNIRRHPPPAPRITLHINKHRPSPTRKRLYFRFQRTRLSFLPLPLPALVSPATHQPHFASATAPHAPHRRTAASCIQFWMSGLSCVPRSVQWNASSRMIVGSACAPGALQYQGRGTHRSHRVAGRARRRARSCPRTARGCAACSLPT